MALPHIGDPAPDFELPNENGDTVKLADYRGAPLILYFYPKDDTPGCTKEACALRDDYSEYQEVGVAILGVSADSPSSHRKFQAKYNLPFSLLADEDHKICEAYGVWVTKKFRGREYLGIKRTTFIIDEEGNISHIFENVKPASHSQQLLEAISA